MKLPRLRAVMQCTLLASALAANAVSGQPNPSIIRCPGGHLEALAFSDDGKWIALAFFDMNKQTRFVGVWDATSLRPIFIDREKAGYKGIEGLAFSADNKQLIALGGCQDCNELIIWDTASRKRIKEQVRPRERLDPHLRWGYQTRELLRGANGRWLLHDTIAGLVIDLETGKVVHDYDKKFPDHEHGVSSDGGIIVSNLEDGPCKVYDAITGKLLNVHPQLPGIYLDFSRHGMVCSFFSDEGWIITMGNSLKKRVLDFDPESKKPDQTQLSPDGRWVAVSYHVEDEKKPVALLFPGEYIFQQIIDTHTGRPVGPVIGGMRVCFSPKGERIAVVSKDYDVGILAVPPSTK